MPISADMISGVLSFIFTILVLSYLIGDNALFRIAVYIFVGVASGYAASVIWLQVLTPRLFIPTQSVLMTGDLTQGALLIVPWLGFGFILMKLSPRLSGVARITMAFLVGAGAAVILAGAVIGTLIPQINATINFFDLQLAAERDIRREEVLGNGVIILVGAVTSLAYFHFGARPKADGSTNRLAPIEILAWIGRIFIGITLGVIFAGVFAAALTAFIERLSFLFEFIDSLLSMFRS